MTTWCPSPNFSERRGGLQAQYVVLHYTAMDSARAAIDRLCAPEFEVSAHYVIDEHGRVTQLVGPQQEIFWRKDRRLRDVMLSRVRPIWM